MVAINKKCTGEFGIVLNLVFKSIEQIREPHHIWGSCPDGIVCNTKSFVFLQHILSLRRNQAALYQTIRF
ncbi:MAG: hypothetical protein CMJ47_03770 [Planctomyces sp.]|nr:hypothetical protein [Planctomyces sp.]